MTPTDGSSPRPGGSVPDVIDQDTDPTAPVAAKASEYGVPTQPTGAAGAIMANGGGSIASERVAVAEFDGHPGSYASTTMEDVSTSDGVPVILALAASNPRPEGSAPPTICQAHD